MKIQEITDKLSEIALNLTNERRENRRLGEELQKSKANEDSLMVHNKQLNFYVYQLENNKKGDNKKSDDIRGKYKEIKKDFKRLSEENNSLRKNSNIIGNLNIPNLTPNHLIDQFLSRLELLRLNYII